MNMKKIGASALAIALLAGCGSSSTSAAGAAEETANKEIETLRFQFVPSRDPGEIIAGTEDLKQLVIDAMAEKGYTIGNVDITVSDSYEAAGEALTAGAVDVACLSGIKYAMS